MAIFQSIKKTRARNRLVKCLKRNDPKFVIENFKCFKSLDENEVAQSLIANGHSRYVIQNLQCFCSLNKISLKDLENAGYTAVDIAQARMNPIADIEIVLEDESKSETETEVKQDIKL